MIVDFYRKGISVENLEIERKKKPCIRRSRSAGPRAERSQLFDGNQDEIGNYGDVPSGAERVSARSRLFRSASAKRPQLLEDSSHA